MDPQPCPGHPGAVDVLDTRAGEKAEPIHLAPGEWAEFLAAAKAGRYDWLAGATATVPGGVAGQILAYAQEAGQVTAAQVTEKFGPHARRYLARLADAGLLAREERGTYSVPQGRQ